MNEAARQADAHQRGPARRKMALVTSIILQSVCLDVVAGAFAIGAYYLQKLPAQLPTRFDPGGGPIAFTSAAAAVFLWPALAGVAHLLLSLPAWLDRKAVERRSFYFGRWLILQAGVVLYLLFGEVFTILRGLGKMTSFPLIPAAGLLMMLLGAVLPAFPSDARFGIRLRATRASNRAWKKAHAYGGQVLAAAGVVPLVGFFLPGLSLWLLVGSLVVAVGLIVRHAARVEP